MNRARRLGGTPQERPFALASHVLLSIGVVLTVALVVVSVAALATGRLSVPSDRWHIVGGIAGLYLASHGLRIARLAVLVADPGIGLRRLASLHFFTSAVSVGVPFKLGDVFRAGELAVKTGAVFSAIAVVWIERAFDVGALLLLLLLAVIIGSPDAAVAFASLITIATLFVGITLALIALAPDNLRRTSIYVIHRYDGEWSITLLRWIDAALASLDEVSRLLRRRQASLAALTALIWAFELAAFGFALAPAASLAGLLGFLNTLTEGNTLFSLLDVAGSAAVYTAATQVLLVAMGIPAAVFQARARINSAP